jgi:glutamyl-tRNA reductase
MAPASAEEPAGSAGKVLGRLLNQAVYAGKYVRSEFQLSKGSVSISSAAVELSVMKAQEDLKSSLEHVNVAVVGAGEMSRLLFVHLESHGVKKVTLFNRSPESAQKLKDQFTELETEIHLMDKFESMLGNYDMVFTSTSSRDPIVTKENLEAAGWGNGERSLVLIDISMPSNVEESCNDLDGVHAYDIDELKQVVDRNTARRRKQGEEAEKWIETEIGQFQLWKASVAYQEIIGALNKKYEGVRARVVEKSKGLQDLTDDQRKAVNSATKHLVKQMLNDPINSLRSADIQSKFSVKQLQSLFRLDA